MPTDRWPTTAMPIVRTPSSSDRLFWLLLVSSFRPSATIEDEMGLFNEPFGVDGTGFSGSLEEDVSMELLVSVATDDFSVKLAPPDRLGVGVRPCVCSRAALNREAKLDPVWAVVGAKACNVESGTAPVRGRKAKVDAELWLERVCSSLSTTSFSTASSCCNADALRVTSPAALALVGIDPGSDWASWRLSRLDTSEIAFCSSNSDEANDTAERGEMLC